MIVVSVENFIYCSFSVEKLIDVCSFSVGHVLIDGCSFSLGGDVLADVDVGAKVELCIPKHIQLSSSTGNHSNQYILVHTSNHSIRYFSLFHVFQDYFTGTHFLSEKQKKWGLFNLVPW